MPVKRRKYQGIIFLSYILSVLIIDQVSKALVSFNLAVGESIPLVKNILYLTYVTNSGAAFGLFKNATLIFIAISVVAVAVLSVLIFRSFRKEEALGRPVFTYGIILVFAGALGNLIDRVRFSYVIDFIDVRIWPVFNVADSAITIGTFLLILSFVT